MPSGQLLDERNVDPQLGLSSAEAARRLLADGPNTLRTAPPVPGYLRLLAQFRDPVIYLLLAALSFTTLHGRSKASPGGRSIPWSSPPSSS
ncbi:MAG: cation-transporting P-type ATPase [Burkholderiaceae bacterium]